MSVTSANPDDLGDFVTSAGRRRDRWEDRLADLTSLQNAVVAASPDYNVSSGLLSGIRQAFHGFSQNERFVHTVKTELLRADRDPNTGVATVSDTSVAAALRAAGVAQKPPPVQVEPGVLLGIPPTSGFVDDPICAANGNFLHVDADLSFPGWAAVLDVVRVYNSLASTTIGAFGPGWSSVLDLRIDHVAGGVLRARLADGAIVPFVGGGDELRAVGARPLRVLVADDGWILREGHTKSWTFDDAGRFTGGTAGPATVAVRRDEHDQIVELSEERSGRSVRFEWADGRVASVAASDGRTATYHYDADGCLVKVDRPCGAVAFAVEGTLVTSVTDADGVELARNTYDEGGRVVEQTNELGRTTRYEYSELGTTLVSDTVGGPRNAFTHDPRGNLTAMVDGTGRAMRLTYDDDGRVTSVRDRTGATTSFTFDERGNLLRRVDPDGLAAAWTWDDDDRLLTEVGRDGLTTTYEYAGESRRPVRIVTGDGATTAVTLSDADLPLEVVDPDGVPTRFEWDSDGQLTAITDALGNRTRFAFDDAGELIEVIDASGVSTAFRSDGAGRVVEAIVADATCRFSYTAAGRPLGGSDGEGVSWSATYGRHGRAVAFRDGEGSAVGFEWDRFENLAAVVAPDGARYEHEHDAAGRLVGAVDPQGNRATRTVDGEGRVTEVADAAGRTWRRELDVLGRTATLVAPDGGRTTYRYHPNGAIRRVVHADGSAVTTEVDGSGRIVALTDAAGGRFELRYSAAGRLLERRSPSGRVRTWTYDEAGRVRSMPGSRDDQEVLELDGRGRVLAKQAAGRRTTYDYSNAGELIGVTDGSGSTTVGRDRSGRIISLTHGDDAPATIAWNTRGTLEAATDPTGLTTSFARDLRGRLAESVAANGDATRFAYDTTGFLRELTDPTGPLTRLLDPTGVMTGVRRADGSGVDRTLDPMGRTRSIAANAADATRADFAYDAAGRLASSTRGGATTRFGWTATGRLSWTDGPSGRYEVERDADGEVVVPHVAVPSDVSARDRAGRITGTASGAVYRYDDAGRLAEALDRRGRAWSFTYDDAGFLAAESGPLGDRRYHRGFLGRVERIDDEGGVSTTFEYDSAGRRTRATGSDGSSTHWWWDGLGLLVAVEHRGVDGVVARTDIALDAHNRPYRIRDAPVRWDDARTGKPASVGAEEFVHVEGRTAALPTLTWLDGPDDPWGTDGVDAAHVGYRGELTAGDLVWLGERVYDARTREFLSPDPLLSLPGRPGSQSAYAYGFLDPVNFLDPTGRRPISQEEFDALREREEQGRFGQAWEAITEDPWGTLAMVGVVAVGVGLMFVPGGQLIGAGILIGAAVPAVQGVLTGNFSPRMVALGGAIGAIPGANSYRVAIAVGAGAGGVQEIGAQALSGRPMDWGNVVQQTVIGGATGGLTRGVQVRIGGARPVVDAPTPPTVHAPRPLPFPDHPVLPSDRIAVIGRQWDTAVAQSWPEHEVLRMNLWSIRNNDAWVESVVERRMRVYIASPETKENLWDAAANRQTVFQRELDQLLDAGYTRSGDYLLPPPG